MKTQRGSVSKQLWTVDWALPNLQVAFLEKIPLRGTSQAKVEVSEEGQV